MSFWATAASYIALASSVHSYIKARKAVKKAKRDADRKKGQEIPVDGEIKNTLVAYGRCRIGGARVFREVASEYLYADPAEGADVFLSTGIPGDNVGNTTPYDVDRAYVGLYVTDSEGVITYSLNESSGAIYTEVRVDLTESPKVYREGDSNRLLTATANLEEILLVGAKLMVWHVIIPEGSAEDGYPDKYPTGPKDEPEWEGPKEYIYTLISYDDLTGFAIISPRSYAIIDDRPVQYGSIASALGEDKSGSKREFLFVQQAICYKGIRKVHGVTLNDVRISHHDFKDTARVYINKEGGSSDPLISLNKPDRINAKFPEHCNAAMAFKLDRDEPQYQGVPDVSFILEGMFIHPVRKYH